MSLLWTSIGVEIRIMLGILIGTGIIAMTGIAFHLMRQLASHSDEAMASFQLHPAQTVNEFTVMLGGSIMLLAGGAFYTAGGLTESLLLSNLGLGCATVYIGTIGWAMHRWWRRFP